jgi:sulfur relay (sulfurtransferase) DsrC/TusE family protein
MTDAVEQIPAADPLAGLARDEEGFLLDARDWYPALVEPLAAEAGLPLTAERREIIRYIRNYFETSQSVPGARRSQAYATDLGRGEGIAALPLPVVPARLRATGLQDRGHAQTAQADARCLKAGNRNEVYRVCGLVSCEL